MVREEAFMVRIKSLAVIGALTLATAACGDRPVDRALTGGAIGAAAGNPWAGAAVGAAGGAVIGAATAPRQYYY
jgi:osmotically inducible lipoprotein OsmB